MATSPDAKKIDRESLKTGIGDLYNSKAKAGGAFSAYDAGENTMIQGVSAPYGFTQKSRELTVNPGFKVGSNSGTENFNEKALNYSDTINGGVKKDGVNKISTNWNGGASIQDTLYTTDAGFKLKTIPQQTQFKDAVGENSKQLSIYMKGFNNQRYTAGGFTR